MFGRAEVAELADAPDSKSGARKGVWVRVPPSAYEEKLPARRDVLGLPGLVGLPARRAYDGRGGS